MVRSDTVALTVTKLKSYLTFRISKSSVILGETVKLEGWLTASGMPPLSPIPNRVVTIHGNELTTMDLVTDANGYFSVEFVAQYVGTWHFYATFAGDATYEGCEEEAAWLGQTLFP